MPAELSLQGFSEIADKIEAMGRKGAAAENEALKAGAVPIAKEMESMAPERSKINEVHIKDDIQTSGIKTKGGIKQIEIGPGEKTGWRANYVEWGTRSHAIMISKGPLKGRTITHPGTTARPFIQPAFERKFHEAKMIIWKKLREAIGL